MSHTVSAVSAEISYSFVENIFSFIMLNIFAVAALNAFLLIPTYKSYLGGFPFLF